MCITTNDSLEEENVNRQRIIDKINARTLNPLDVDSGFDILKQTIPLRNIMKSTEFPVDNDGTEIYDFYCQSGIFQI